MLKAPPLILAALAGLLLALPALAADPPKLPDGMQAYLDASKPAWASDAELVKAVADGGANWTELARALDEAAKFSADESQPTDVTYAEALSWLLKNAPHLDRLELTDKMLEENSVQAHDAAARFSHSTKSTFFRRYILNYRLDDEPVTNWRGTLKNKYSSPEKRVLYGEYAASGPSIGAVQLRAISTVICSSFTIRERGFFGNLADPVSIDNSRAGTKREFALLTAAVFRSLGFGTRFVSDNRSGESWVEVYGGGPVGDNDAGYDPNAWLPVYPTAPEHSGDFAYATELCGGRLSVVTAGDAFGREQVTAHYGPVAQVRPVFLKGEGNEEVKDFTSWSVSAWSKGAWVPLDDLEYPSSDKDYPLDEPAGGQDATVWYTLGAPGRYRFTAGLRYPGGVVYVQNSEFEVQPGDHLEHYFGLDAPASLPDAALVERQIASPLPADSKLISASGRYLFLITDDSEPSKRTETMLEPLRSMDSLFYQVYRADTADPAIQSLLLDTLKLDKNDPLPVLILVSDGQARLYLRGYNLNALDWVKRELAR